jgi:hypothetical protein
MTVRGALLQQKQEHDLRRQDHYIERNANIYGGDSQFIWIVIGLLRAGRSFFVKLQLMVQGLFGYIYFG